MNNLMPDLPIIIDSFNLIMAPSVITFANFEYFQCLFSHLDHNNFRFRFEAVEFCNCLHLNLQLHLERFLPRIYGQKVRFIQEYQCVVVQVRPFVIY